MVVVAIYYLVYMKKSYFYMKPDREELTKIVAFKMI
jgi:hypothetical protein